LAISAAIVAIAVAALLMQGRSWHPRTHHDPNPVAQNLYARGRYLLDRQTEPELRQAIECFRQSAARDPQFAAAFAGLSDGYDLLVQYGDMAPREGMEQARSAAQHALSLDPGLAEAYVSLAAISEAYDWDFKKAESQYRRAIELNPELPAAHLWYGMFLRDQGRMPEALPELRRAEQLEPLSVLAAINLAYAFRMTGDSDAALELVRRAEELDPDCPMLQLMLAGIYRARSNSEDAEATLALARSLAADNPHALSALACTYAMLGRRAESVNLLNLMQQLATERYVSPFDLGNVALTLGDDDRAVTWFEEAYRQRSAGMVFLRRERSESIKHLPRLQSLIRRMGNG
jgi:serine/threonine-protein kinase